MHILPIAIGDCIQTESPVAKEESMEKGFFCGMILGLTAGALVVANSYKARKLVKEGQEQIKTKVTEMAKKGNGKSDEYEELGE